VNVNWFDATIIGLIGVSSVISIIRGFVREAMSLIVWIAALWVTLTFSNRLADLFQTQIHSSLLRTGIAAVVLFFGALILGVLINSLLALLIDKTGLTSTDRLLGVVFGAARGILVVGVLILIAQFSTLPTSSSWHESYFIPKFQPMEQWLQELMEQEIQVYLPDKAGLLKNANEAPDRKPALPNLFTTH
jgi:membrane protein required for colicin V production